MKIRIFALAKELGLDSKDLIDVAAQAGISIKNSALASISPEERDVVVARLKQSQGGKASAASKAAEDKPLTPTREVAAETGKLRAIKTMLPRPQLQRNRREAEPPEEAREAATATVEVEAPPEAPSPEAPESGTAPPIAAEAPAGEKARTENGGVVPISREDYVPASGSASSSIREMRPRGTIRESDPGQDRRSKAKALPNLAAIPQYRAPKREQAGEAPAQKPEVRLTPDLLDSQSPLASRMHRNAEQKEKRRKLGDALPADMRTLQRGEMESEIAPAARRVDRRRSSRPLSAEDSMLESRIRAPRRRRQRGSSGPVELKTSAQIELPISVRSLSEAIGRPAKALLQVLWNRGEMLNINDPLTEEAAQEVAMELGVDLEIKRGRDVEEELSALFNESSDSEHIELRPPIVTILGHVDHGKTTLVDKLRSANVAAGEAGGITQHIAAYQVEHNNHKITFVDTPGHAAFGEMRARGANVTDIVVLVVAANDGVMQQTVECISHARAAGVPMIVAMNKVDLPDKDEQRVLQGLAQQEVLPAEWGGETEVIRTSGKTGQGLDQLLETILVTAELNEYKADPDQPAVGVCLEAFRDEGRGVIAWLIVQKGTLRVGDIVLCGEAHGRIRGIYNDRDEELTEAGPSTPVKISGLDVVPGAGDHFFVMSEIDEARTVAASRHQRGRAQTLAGRKTPRTLDDILAAARGGAVQDLPLIIKADTPGSLEALRGEVEKLEHPEVRVQIIHEGVGGVNESDVSLASASGAIVIAFHVIAEDRASQLAEREGVDIRRYNIIYEVTEHIKRSLEGLLLPEKVEVSTGRAIVLRTFHISRFGTVAGCRVLAGTIERSHRIHLIRDQKVLNDYDIASLKREKDDAREVREGMECGIRLEGFNDVKEGDLLEAFRVDEVKRTLESAAAAR